MHDGPTARMSPDEQKHHSPTMGKRSDMRDGRPRSVQLVPLLLSLVLPLRPDEHVDVVHLELVHVARHEEGDVRDAVAGEVIPSAKILALQHEQQGHTHLDVPAAKNLGFEENERAESTVYPPAELPRMTMRFVSTQSDSSCAAVMQSSASAMPHWPFKASM